MAPKFHVSDVGRRSVRLEQKNVSVRRFNLDLNIDAAPDPNSKIPASQTSIRYFTQFLCKTYAQNY